MTPKLIAVVSVCLILTIAVGVFAFRRFASLELSSDYTVTDHELNPMGNVELSTSQVVQLNGLLEECLESEVGSRIPSFTSFRPRFVLEGTTLRLNFLNEDVVIEHRGARTENWLQFVTDKTDKWQKVEGLVRTMLASNQ